MAMLKQYLRLANWVRTLVLLVSFTTSLCAQTEHAGITGTVRDAQGKAIPDALVETRQVDTMLARAARTSDSGVFFIGALPIGNYTVSITHPGFSPVQIASLRLFVGQTRT